ncbi:hypothetical protein BO86DRAFT_416569 [Aspergillus japonicus CBS 114.51]|uniref:Uncharacterized protein n=1 Tax=Aspergillus japonicus CBS 114.51 TaxID=1448312 RepID=A0A8T8XAR0_ASPJA|nr:hypothetical protein BO86DRAFT_416569 [Aspergillus japonicus CBS 114.51]RAH85145.1 hypothetical protein BO86DRAFT_416569 [Aspergillus japonicus CBS 114.51]
MVHLELILASCLLESKYHDREPSEFDPPDREVNLFVSESTAYHCRPTPSFPNLQPIDPSNFLEQHLGKLRAILDNAHWAKVLHHNSKPRNITFNSAQVFPEYNPSLLQEKRVTDEVELVDYFINALARDFEEGRLNCTILYYYNWFQ